MRRERRRTCGRGTTTIRSSRSRRPSIGDYDAVYRPIDTVKSVRKFYEGIGLPIDDVLGRSDLFEKPGKSPHAFSSDIDREGDVRVLANVVPGEEWLETMLHECGHAAYSRRTSRGAFPTSCGSSRTP